MPTPTVPGSPAARSSSRTSPASASSDGPYSRGVVTRRRAISSPLMVSLVQAATTMPLFLLALPGGALADILDRRRVLLVAQVWLFLMAALLGVLTVTGVVQPWMLLAITLAIGAGSAVDIPAWQAMIPEVVPREALPVSVGP